MKQGRYPEAADDYTHALERRPDAEIYLHRGWAHFFSDGWKLALRDFNQAIERKPDQADAYTGRGLCLVMLGRYRQAVTDAEEALRRRADGPERMFNIACLFAQAAARAEADSGERKRRVLAYDYRQRAPGGAADCGEPCATLGTQRILEGQGVAGRGPDADTRRRRIPPHPQGVGKSR